MDNNLENRISYLERQTGNLQYNFYQHQHMGFDFSKTLPTNYSRLPLIDAATISTDVSIGNHFYVNLTGSRTLAAPTGARGGHRVIWEFIQDNSGSRAITLNSIFNAGSFTITLTTTANKRDFLEAVYSDVDSTWYIINFVKNY